MKKTISSIALLMSLLAMLIGCSTPELDDGYQFGDVTRIAIREEKDIKQAINDYCDKAKDSAIRQAALAVIRTKYPFVPENGICG